MNFVPLQLMQCMHCDVLKLIAYSSGFDTSFTQEGVHSIYLKTGGMSSECIEDQLHLRADGGI